MLPRKHSKTTLSIILLAAFVSLAVVQPAPAGTTADARAAGNGAAVSIDAVISSTTDLIASGFFKSFYIQDAVGGITVFGSSAAINSLLAAAGEGDSITISGTTASFRGLFELIGPFIVTNTGSPGVPTPAAVTGPDFQDLSATAEELESTLVTLANVTFVGTGPGETFAGGTNYTVTDGSNNVSVRISHGGLDLAGTLIPTGPVDITGIFGQFDFGNPLPGEAGVGYQLLPRKRTDINCIPFKGQTDCNTNDIPDECDLGDRTSQDCNLNNVPDECELPGNDCDGDSVLDECEPDCNADGTPDDCEMFNDCNNDGVPDDCLTCPTVEVVFVMDTSESMRDEAAALCGSISQVEGDLRSAGIEVNALLLGISTSAGGDFSCLTGNVVDLFGQTVPGSPPPGNELLGDCPGGVQAPSEDWGRATSVVAGLNNWLPDSVRVIVPLSDEGPWCGDPVTDPGVDRDAITHAISVAQANNVIVSPITGTGSSPETVGLAEEIAKSTGGTAFASTDPSADVAGAIEALVLAACSSAFADCNNNAVPDECDVDPTDPDGDSQVSPDCNENEIPDECDIADCPEDDPACQDCNDNGIPDECESDADGDGIIDDCDPCPLPCVWDIDGSGDVRVPDLIKLLSCWGPLTGDPDCACLDIDTSGDVRVPDLIALLAKWGVCP